MNYKKLESLKKEDVEGKVFLVRVGLNVPVSNGAIESDFRLEKILETLDFLLKKKAKVVLIGHIGRKKEKSLKIVFKWLKKRYKEKVFFDENTFVEFDEKKVAKKVEDLKGGEILLLDNLRATDMEKGDSTELAEKVSVLGDFYVNEAFSVAHRKHMSVSSLPESFPAGKTFLGFQFEKELNNVEKIKKVSGKKSVFVLGGSKIATKIPMIEKMLERFDFIILGGAIANSFYKECGYEIGKSLVDKDFVFQEGLFEKIMNSGKIFLPNIVVTKEGEKEVSEIQKNEKILDISPMSFFEIEDDLRSAKFVFFNGPVGFYEGGYTEGTKFLLETLDNDGNYFTAGGGNTVSAILELGLGKKVDFLSTGGGALIKKLSE